MPIGTDFEIQADRDIRYIGAAHEVAGAGYYTGLEFHEWLRGLGDDGESSGDDFYDISLPDSSNKIFETIIELKNSFNIDQTAAEHLYACSIIQNGGDDIWDGIQVVAPEGTHMEILQNGSIESNDFWNSTPSGESSKGLNRDVANGISMQFILKVRTAGADIDGRRFIATTREEGLNFGERKINGTSRGVNVVALPGGDTDLNNTTAWTTVATWTTITNLSEGYNGIDVDNDSTDEYYYSKWDRDEPTYTINQFYERMKWLTRRGSSSTLYGLNGEVFRGITHEIDVDSVVGNWDEDYEPVSWSGGTGQLLAKDHATTPTKIWIQLLTGVAPTDGQTITGGTSGATADVDTNVVERTVSTPFCGASTGTTIIGAYGFALQISSLSSDDKVFDLTNTLNQTPNYVDFDVNSLVSGEDYVLVGPRGYRYEYDNEASGPFTVGEELTFTSPAGTADLADIVDQGSVGMMFIGPIKTGSAPTDNSTITGGTSSATADVKGAVSNDINLRQMTLDGALTGAGVTSVVVNETIPDNTPATGTIRIKRANGKYSRHPYSAVSSGTKTFTITSHDFSTNNANDDAQVFISYLDLLATSATESFTSIFSSILDLFIRVRDGQAGSPTKTFETVGTQGSAGGSTTRISQSDA